MLRIKTHRKHESFSWKCTGQRRKSAVVCESHNPADGKLAGEKSRTGDAFELEEIRETRTGNRFNYRGRVD